MKCDESHHHVTTHKLDWNIILHLFEFYAISTYWMLTNKGKPNAEEIDDVREIVSVCIKYEKLGCQSDKYFQKVCRIVQEYQPTREGESNIKKRVIIIDKKTPAQQSWWW